MLALIVGGLLIWFFSPGIHFLGSYAHFDFEKKYYILNSTGTEIVKESVMTVRGTAHARNQGEMFSGELTLEGYLPVPGEKVICMVNKSDDRWLMVCKGYVPEEPGGLVAVEGTERLMAVYFRWEEQGTVYDEVVAVTHTNPQKDTLYAVCADSAEEAMEILKLFRQ